MVYLVTGGAGFIGSNFVHFILKNEKGKVIVLDKLTYAGNLNNLENVRNDPNFLFVKGDISDQLLVDDLLKNHKVNYVVNFAAETHVDRSIHDPAVFVKTNILGTFYLLECAKNYLKRLTKEESSQFRFLHVSTDEVYGSLNLTDPLFKEDNKYSPNSPYSASKASSDHMVRAYHHTYGLPVLTTNCSNNYGAFQFPEKLIPLVITNALENKKIPIYGDGKNIRDWLFVEDHCSAILQVLEKGLIGETYNIGGWNEKTNLEVVNKILELLDVLSPKSDNTSYKENIIFVKDRPGHDYRYAIDASKLKNELKWFPKETFDTGIEKTVKWYLENKKWLDDVKSGDYLKWINVNYSID